VTTERQAGDRRRVPRAGAAERQSSLRMKQKTQARLSHEAEHTPAERGTEQPSKVAERMNGQSADMTVRQVGCCGAPASFEHQSARVQNRAERQNGQAPKGPRENGPAELSQKRERTEEQTNKRGTENASKGKTHQSLSSLNEGTSE